MDDWSWKRKMQKKSNPFSINMDRESWTIFQGHFCTASRYLVFLKATFTSCIVAFADSFMQNWKSSFNLYKYIVYRTAVLHSHFQEDERVAVIKVRENILYFAPEATPFYFGRWGGIIRLAISAHPSPNFNAATTYTYYSFEWWVRGKESRTSWWIWTRITRWFSNQLKIGFTFERLLSGLKNLGFL